jgi:hypothetical protein
MWSFWKENPVEQAVVQECVESSSAIVGKRGAIISLSLGPQIRHFAFSLSLPFVTDTLTISIATFA